MDDERFQAWDGQCYTAAEWNWQKFAYGVIVVGIAFFIMLIIAAIKIL